MIRKPTLTHPLPQSLPEPLPQAHTQPLTRPHTLSLPHDEKVFRLCLGVPRYPSSGFSLPIPISDPLPVFRNTFDSNKRRNVWLKTVPAVSRCASASRNVSHAVSLTLYKLCSLHFFLFLHTHPLLTSSPLAHLIADRKFATHHHQQHHQRQHISATRGKKAVSKSSLLPVKFLH